MWFLVRVLRYRFPHDWLKHLFGFVLVQFMICTSSVYNYYIISLSLWTQTAHPKTRHSHWIKKHDPLKLRLWMSMLFFEAKWATKENRPYFPCGLQNNSQVISINNHLSTPNNPRVFSLLKSVGFSRSSVVIPVIRYPHGAFAYRRT